MNLLDIQFYKSESNHLQTNLYEHEKTMKDTNATKNDKDLSGLRVGCAMVRVGTAVVTPLAAVGAVFATLAIALYPAFILAAVAAGTVAVLSHDLYYLARNLEEKEFGGDPAKSAGHFAGLAGSELANTSPGWNKLARAANTMGKAFGKKEEVVDITPPHIKRWDNWTENTYVLRLFPTPFKAPAEVKKK